MIQYIFQLESGAEFTVPALTTAGAWRAAIEFLVEQGEIENLSTLAFNGMK